MAQPGLRKLPIGVQDFPSLREDGDLSVDKAALACELTTKGRVYLLSRPRRFGKSLRVSTLGAYFEGRRELFDGQAIAKLESEWVAHPGFGSISMPRGTREGENGDAGTDAGPSRARQWLGRGEVSGVASRTCRSR